MPALFAALMSATLQWGHRLSSTETDVRGALFITSDRASMGPSTFVDGDGRPPSEDPRVVRLQWGHRLSSTETAEQVRPGVIMLELQWGHRLSSTETSRLVVPSPSHKIASMGPSTFVDGD